MFSRWLGRTVLFGKDRNAVISLAVAIVLGQTIYAVLAALIDFIVVPPIGLMMGGKSFPSLFFNLTPDKKLRGIPIDSIEQAHYAGASIIAYGAFWMTCFHAMAAFFVAIVVTRALRKSEVESVAQGETKMCPFCCSQIPQAAVRCSFCTSMLAEAPNQTWSETTVPQA